MHNTFHTYSWYQVDIMIEEPKNALEEIAADPNFFMILAGAAIWFIGYYLGILSPLFVSTGFVLVCFSAALTSLKRPVALAWPGLLLGGLFQIIGYYLSWVLIVGPALIVTGGVMVVYFAIPLALQRGELPVLTRLQKLIDSKKKGEEIEDIEPEEPQADDEAEINDDSASDD
jgi:hypothetical protein